MKKLLFLLLFISLNLSAQDYSEDAKKAAQTTDIEYADRLRGYIEADKRLAETQFPQQVRFTGEAEPILNELLKDFHQSARWAKVGNIKQMDSVRSILFVKADLNMLGEISPDGKTIYLNEELRQFKHLRRVVLMHQIGHIYGLKHEKYIGHAIMGTHWELDIKHEYFAKLMSVREEIDRNFFEALAKKAPLEKRL
jgi:hypothetical protein